MTQLLCEEFNVPSLIIANSAVLTTLASCRTTALVVDCGGGSTIVTPVVHCRSLAQAVISSPVAGEVLTDCLTRRLENNGQLLKIGRKATETITRGNLLVQSRKNCADSLKLHITMWKAMNFLMAAYWRPNFRATVEGASSERCTVGMAFQRSTVMAFPHQCLILEFGFSPLISDRLRGLK
ncbi:uncharacterized protein LOC126594592 isoform X1 [Malus sylvestris]|uniref:uncharacterized protein LOC126594592 isoform X1 n=1 Tax=Malus sylvestris TaxID=3752 RepID=UPI0021AC07E7|nr:uncharacterized protein LOC126594592 isoform X1 [Malus sylvestris]